MKEKFGAMVVGKSETKVDLALYGIDTCDACEQDVAERFITVTVPAALCSSLILVEKALKSQGLVNADDEMVRVPDNRDGLSYIEERGIAVCSQC